MDDSVGPQGDAAVLTIEQASALMRCRKLSPVELAAAAFRRIRALDPVLHTHVLVTEEQGMAAARSAEAEIMAGRWRGPLHGVPIGIKDIYNMAGLPTTGHSALFRDHVPHEDATVIRLMREAGAVFTGKLATWEFATGGPSFDLPWPPARNPWNIEHDPSGSSSGSGAAVASGLCLGATGSDTTGSIRGPAAWCGIAGHKPTYGLVSKAGVLPLSFSFDHAGPMCWTVRDCALMMHVIAGHDPADGCSADLPPLDFLGRTEPIAGVRVGVVRHFFETDLPCEPDVAAAFAESLRVLADLGARVGDATLSPLAAYSAVAGQIWRPEAYSVHQSWLKRTPHLYGALARQRLMAGALVSGVAYVNAQRERRRLVDELAAVMRDFDILAFPTARKTAGRLDARQQGVSAFYNRVCSVTGSPALSVCNGFSDDGLPIGLHLTGRPFEDPLVLRVGEAFENAAGWRSRRPVIPKSERHRADA